MEKITDRRLSKGRLEASPRILVVVVKLLGSLRTMVAHEVCKDDCEYVNKSNKKPFRTILTEDDIPGASLKRRKAEQLKNDKLKHWLKCRGASVSGTRMQLLQR